MQHNAIIYFDIAAVVIMLISLASLLLRGLTKGSASRVYLTVMTLVTLSALAALAGEVYDVFFEPLAQDDGAVSEAALVVPAAIAMVYYLLRSLTVPAYLVLIATVSDTTHRLDDNNVVWFLLWVPMVAVAAFILSNPIHQLVFSFDDGILQRGPCLQVLYFEAVYYSVISAIWLVYWRKLFSLNELVTLVLIYPVMIIATVVQYNVQGLRLEMFVTSVAMMLVSAFVIHPETRYNTMVNASSLKSYREMVNRAFITGKHLCLVYVEVVNIEQLRELVGRVELQGLLRGVSENLSRTLERDDVLYYLQNGTFCISSRNIDPEHAASVAWQAHEKGKARAMAQREGMTGPEMRSCIVRIPEDVVDIGTLKNFGKCFSRLVPASTVTSFRELSEQDGFALQMGLSDVVERAIKERSFEVYYQPIYCLEDGRFHSAEALVRLNDPELGWVSPSLFIPDAEQNGTIVDIGDILLEKICAFLGEVDYEATGLEYVEVNLSVDQCIRPEMAGELLARMEASGVAPSRVNVEITETSASYSQQVIEKNAFELAKAGVTLSLDDYGTGYSNLTRILSLPFTLVKIDKCFVDGLDDESVRSVTADTVSMLKSIGKRVLVEGVETREQYEAIADMGVDYIQGYYFARPMPQDSFVGFLRDSAMRDSAMRDSSGAGLLESEGS